MLGGGRYVGVDRSPKMVAAAARRNAAAVDDGRATFLVGEVPDVDLGAATFDCILAARVAAMVDAPAPCSRPGTSAPVAAWRWWSTDLGQDRTRASVDAAVAAAPAAGFTRPTVDLTTVDGAVVAVVSARLA